VKELQLTSRSRTGMTVALLYLPLVWGVLVSTLRLAPLQAAAGGLLAGAAIAVTVACALYGSGYRATRRRP
jgi:hypothetical protein